MLKREDSPGFNICGTHNTISACALPPWIPEDILDWMNQFVEIHLERKLAALMDDPLDLLENRSPSTGSDTHSLDSFQGRNRDSLLFNYIKDLI
jgi:hypothetical protein